VFRDAEEVILQALQSSPPPPPEAPPAKTLWEVFGSIVNGFLLDTNVPSELIRTLADPRVQIGSRNQRTTELLPRFHNRILGWAMPVERTLLSTADGMIAATALEHELTLVRRNVKDFAGAGCRHFRRTLGVRTPETEKS